MKKSSKENANPGYTEKQTLCDIFHKRKSFRIVSALRFHLLPAAIRIMWALTTRSPRALTMRITRALATRNSWALTSTTDYAQLLTFPVIYYPFPHLLLFHSILSSLISFIVLVPLQFEFFLQVSKIALFPTSLAIRIKLYFHYFYNCYAWWSCLDEL